MKKIIILSLMLPLFFKGYSQTSDPNGYINNYNPPSPESSALGKYVEHPVGKFTGTPEIKIPLFDIQCGRIKIPIDISYHGSGVKIDEVASRTGIGWVLNAGGVVTKTLKGMWTDEGSLYGYFTGSYATHIGQFNDLDKLTRLDDLEPDEHFYNFNGHMGKIYFTDKTHPYTSSLDPIKVNGPYNGSNKFVITAEDGLIYTFDATEQSDVANTTTQGGGTHNVFVSSWYLTRIDDPVTGKNVQFQYRTDAASSLTYSQQTGFSSSLFSQTSITYSILNTQLNQPKILNKIIYDDGYIQFQSTFNRHDLTGDNAYTDIYQYANASTPVLIKSYHFEYVETSNGSGQNNYRLYLESIQEKGSDGSYLPSYQFFYKNRNLLPERQSVQQDIWGYYNNNSGQPSGTDGNKIYVVNNNGKQTYLPFFSAYFTPNQTVNGLDRSSNASTIDYGTLSKIIYPTKGYTTYDYEVNRFGSNGAFTDIYSGGGIRIKYIKDYSADGQILLSKMYNYEHGELGGAYPQVGFYNGYYWIKFSQSQTALGSCQGSYVGYGKVVEVQNAANGSSSTNGSTEYFYSQDPDVAGVFTSLSGDGGYMSDPAYVTTYRATTYYPFFEMESREARRGILQREYVKDNNNNLIKGTNYHYSLVSQLITPIYSFRAAYNGQSGTVDYGFESVRNLNAEKMQLDSKAETVYRGTGDQTALPGPIIDSTSYTYTAAPYLSSFIREEKHFVAAGISGTLYKYPFDYSSTASGGIMNTMTTMNYVSPVISKIQYRSSAQGSSGVLYNSVQINNYKHNPYYAGGTNPNSIVPAQVYTLKTMVPTSSASAASVLDPGAPGTLFEKRAEYINYDAYANPVLLVQDGKYQILTWDWSYGKFLISQKQVASSLAQDFSLPPQSWNEVTDAAARTGNTEFQWSGSNVAFPITLDGQSLTNVSFWAKGGTFSVTPVSSGHVDDISVNQTAPSTWKHYSFNLPTVSQDWANGLVYLTGTARLDDVSITTGGNVLITNYNYDPLRRLQSITDPNGNLKKYEYDSFSRLINVRDQSDNIIKHYDYHYKGQ